MIVLEGDYLCDCGTVVHAGRWCALEVDGVVVCGRCPAPAVWVEA